MVEESGGVRDLKILAGERMLTPVRPIVSRDGKQRYFPKRHRFSVDAELVRERPELFELCMPRSHHGACGVPGYAGGCGEGSCQGSRHGAWWRRICAPRGGFSARPGALAPGSGASLATVSV
jgi:hypothetical protein